MIRVLVVLGANVAIPDLHGRTAVHYCAQQGHIEPLKALLSPLQAHELELRVACLPCCAHFDTIGAYTLEYRQRVLSTLLMRDVNGMTPLTLAHLAREDDAAELVLIFGAEVCRRSSTITCWLHSRAHIHDEYTDPDRWRRRTSAPSPKPSKILTQQH